MACAAVKGVVWVWCGCGVVWWRDAWMAVGRWGRGRCGVGGGGNTSRLKGPDMSTGIGY